MRNNNRSEEHTSELQSHSDLVCRLLLEKKKKRNKNKKNAIQKKRQAHKNTIYRKSRTAPYTKADSSEDPMTKPIRESVTHHDRGSLSVSYFFARLFA